jgi:hypothetical protein
MRLPYKERVPLLWDGKGGERVLERMIEALGEETVVEVCEAAEEYSRRVWSGEKRPFDDTTIPRNDEELVHFREVQRREYLAHAIYERIYEEGDEVCSYSWDGDGESTSPGSSFYEMVKEWKGFYAWVSEVDGAGPFTTEEEAMACMGHPCGDG